ILLHWRCIMFKSFKINLFLFRFKLIFIFFKLFPLQKKTTFVTDYGVNVTYVASQVDLQTNEDIIILKSESCLEEFDEDRFRVILFSSKKLVSYLKSIFHLATSSYIIVDSDFLFLAGTPLKPGAKCIQLWHSTGSVKNFGYMRRTLPQYDKVFDNMDYIVTGSPLMTQFYKEAFKERDDDVFIKSGIPSTDFFFNDDYTIYPILHDIALASDLLLADYSSLLFEYAHIHKPMITCAFDTETFKKNRGLTIAYENFVPGPVVKTNTELIQRIKENNF